VRALVRLGEILGVSEGTVRVALSRLVAEGAVVAADGRYRLSEPFLRRQAELDRGRSPELRPWRGAWELAVLPDAADPATRTDTGARLARLGLAPLRDGVWMRPANLARDAAAGAPAARWMTARPDGDPATLAAELWDLGAWSAEAARLLAALADEAEPATRFALAAAIARLLGADPVLPAPLLPPHWPGTALRAAYRSYEAELGRLLRAAGEPGAAGREARARHRAR